MAESGSVGSVAVEKNDLANVTPQLMRAVLGTFTSGVVVVTAMADEPIGFTCQSFASLSLDPPLISFSPARTSTTWPAIREVGRFCINVLAHDQHELSERFATMNLNRFDGVSWSPSPSGAPVLHGVSAWIDCELANEYGGGDHTIAVGAVRALGSDGQRHPLIYYRGRYAPSEHWEAWPIIP
jgi:3-hydroxy-9,10-secoandrosta-1,3,5(10)-triene-9,17-dione monooxygenase reductase component